MKLFVLKIWNIIKTFLTWLWNTVKKWAVETAWPWIKKSWIQIVNVLIVLFAYGKLVDAAIETISLWPSVLVGLWAFILLGYWIFWKFFGFDKVIKKLFKDRKKK